MGKILRYMTTIALAAVMLFGTMTTAFAVENSGQVVGNDQKGSITIHKYKMPDAENAFESNTENGGTHYALWFFCGVCFCCNFASLYIVAAAALCLWTFGIDFAFAVYC